MVAHDELNVDTSRLSCSGSVGGYHHSFNAFGVAGRSQFIGSFDFNYTYSACADIVNSFKVAEMRDLDTDLICCFHDSGAFRHRDLLTVYGYVYHLSSLPPLKAP